MHQVQGLAIVGVESKGEPGILHNLIGIVSAGFPGLSTPPMLQQP